MVRKPDPATEQRWRRLICELQQGTGTVAEFAAAHGVSTASIYHWKKRLGMSSGASRRRRSRKRASARRSNGNMSSFVSLSVVASDRVEVELPSGVRIHVPATHVEALETAISASHQVAKEGQAC